MKYLLLGLALFGCMGMSFAQSKKEQIKELQRQNDSLNVLVRSLSDNNRLLLTSLDSTRQFLLDQEAALAKEKKTNEVMRDIMRGYIKNIDELNTELQKLREKEDLGKTKKSTLDVNDLIIREPDGVPENPFAEGSMGMGSGSSYGSGSFGADSGYDAERERVRLNNVSVNDIEITEDARIVYKLLINADGDVVKYACSRSNTTTTNQVLINEIGEAIRKQVKYNKVPGAPQKYVFYSVVLRAN